MTDFRALPNQPTLHVGLALHDSERPGRYLRLTHIFEDGVYAMWVGTPEEARYAKRPIFYSWNQLSALTSPTSKWGRIVLPQQLSVPAESGSSQAGKIQSAGVQIAPVIQAFENRTNLSRHHFTALIRERALSIDVAEKTLHRLILRYYYFGSTKIALVALPRGPKRTTRGREESGEKDHANGEIPDKANNRRGRKTILSDELGPNNFVVTPDDVDDMLRCYKQLLRKGPTNKTTAHETYLSTFFQKSHPDTHRQYIKKQISEPVTYRQFCYYINGELQLTEDLARNERRLRRDPANTNSLVSAGPGEIYEIDSTGGRLYLVSSEKNPVVVGKPTIYFLIDRWSRFVVSAYISLRAPSYEEVRNTLLIAFTSREKRFSRLGIEVSDNQWPIGCIPAVICPDRGSDFMSGSMLQSVVDDLRIDLTPLPPLCPDGKAIVERLIRTIKQRMAASGMKGVYADRPLDPQSRRAARKAEAAAVHTLADAYRALIEIVKDYNNRPHQALKRRKILTQHGIEPTPKNAYVWGLENITGLRSAPYTEEDYYRLLLSSDKASISGGVLRYKTRVYHPSNEAAIDYIRRSPRNRPSLDIRLDKTQPAVIMIASRHGEWPCFVMGAGDARDSEGISIDEEEAFAAVNARLWARSDHESRRVRVAAKAAKPVNNRHKSAPAERLPNVDMQRARYQETAKLKNKLHAQTHTEFEEHTASASVGKSWSEVEREEKARLVELVKLNRSKR